MSIEENNDATDKEKVDMLNKKIEGLMIQNKTYQNIICANDISIDEIIEWIESLGGHVD